MDEETKMSEEKTSRKDEGEKKRALRIAAGILHWGWVILLGVLLIAGIVFSAPWKVTALLLVFLLAATALPRGKRKWFWAGVGVVVIVLIVWVFLPEDNEGWRPFTFDKETAALQEKYAAPDAENAALIYKKLVDVTVIDEKTPEFFIKTIPSSKSGPWTTKEHPEMAKWLQAKRLLIEKVVEATKLRRCAFPIPCDPMKLGDGMKLLSPMRQWTFLLIAAGNNTLAEGRTGEALEKQLAALMLGRHLCQQPTMVYILFGQAIETLALMQINKTVIEGDVDSGYLDAVDETIGQMRPDWRGTFEGVLETDKLQVKNILAQMTYQINEAGQVRRSGDTGASKRKQTRKSLESGQVKDKKTLEYMRRTAYPGYLRRKAKKAKGIVKWFAFPARPEQMAAIIDAAYEQYTELEDPNYSYEGQPRSRLSITQGANWRRFEFDLRYMVRIVTEQSENNYYTLRDTFRRAESIKRGTRVVVALRRYKNANGKWPDNLRQAAQFGPEDVFADGYGGPFVYKSVGNNFVLYSKGKNGIDDGGEHNKQTGLDDWVIWPRGKKQKENSADER